MLQIFLNLCITWCHYYKSNVGSDLPQSKSRWICSPETNYGPFLNLIEFIGRLVSVWSRLCLYLCRDFFKCLGQVEKLTDSHVHVGNVSSELSLLFWLHPSSTPREQQSAGNLHVCIITIIGVGVSAFPRHVRRSIHRRLEQYTPPIPYDFALLNRNNEDNCA